MTNWNLKNSMEDVRRMERELGYSARCPKICPPVKKQEGVRYEVIETTNDPVVDGVIVEVPAEATQVCESDDKGANNE